MPILGLEENRVNDDLRVYDWSDSHWNPEVFLVLSEDK
jgi:hypothetical protein